MALRPSHDPPKVLIVAPNASSLFGGEAYIPLQYFRILRARGYPARLVTHARNRCDLLVSASSYFDKIAFVEDTALHRLLHRCSAYFPTVIAETLFGTLMTMLDAAPQRRIVQDLIDKGLVDVIHQPTPVSPLAPSSLHRFGLPLIIGPMNGGMDYPPGYDALQGTLARSFVRVSRGVAWLSNRLIPGKRRAAMLLVANQRTRQALPFAKHPDIRIIPENGVQPAQWQPRQPRRVEAGRLRLVYLGRLVDWKLVDVTLEAVAAACRRGAQVTIDIVGDGDQRARLEALAGKLGLEEAVRFHGFKPQGECAAIVGQADALILNSVRECGGSVVLEAMAAGLPVIASDWGGPADYLDESCGLLVSPSPPHDFASRLADAIVKLADDPAFRLSLAENGIKRACTHFDWEKKVDMMTDLYAEAGCGDAGLTAAARKMPSEIHASHSRRDSPNAPPATASVPLTDAPATR